MTTQDVRKSEPLVGEAAGNTQKYDSYREAWMRIKLAQNNHFYLEAVTIEESIISDRLISFLSRNSVANPIVKNSRGRWPSFGQLIQRWRAVFPDGLPWGDRSSLIDDVDQWRKLRNEAVHAIVKSDPGEPTEPVESFLQKSEEAAAEGEKLAREVCHWHTKQKRQKTRTTQAQLLD